MRLSRIIRFAAYALFAASIPAYADPITAAVSAIAAWVATASTATLITIGLTALELGASFIGLSMLKKPASGAGINGEEQEGGLVPQAFPFGNAATGGSIVYRNVWGKAGKIPNAYYTKVIALSDIPLPSDALKYVWVDDKKCTFGSGTPDSDMGYALPEMATDGGHDHAWVKFYDGTQTAADPWLVSLFGSDLNRPYGSDRVGYGRAYVIITFLNTKHFDLYRGWPKTLFEVDGAKLYDVRKDTSEGGSGTHRLDDPTTWETTENPQVVRYHLRRGITYANRHFFGLQNMVAARVPYDNWVAAMNECDTTVTTDAGGTEPQFRCGGEISVGTEMASIDESLMLACNARSIEIGGIYKTTTGAIGSSILSFTDADLLIDQPQTLDQYPGVGSIVNGVTAHYPEPAEQWQRKDAPPLYNSTYEAEDGGRFSADLKFDAVPFGEQVQRQMKSNLEENRRWSTHNVVFPHTAAKLEPGDAADWSSGRNSYSAKIFRIESIKRLRNRNVAAVLREADPSDYDWTPSSDYITPTLGTITRYDIPNLAMSGWTVSAVTISGDNGTALPGIRMAWDTVDLDGIVGVSTQIRLASSGAIINSVPLIETWEDGFVDIGSNLLPNTAYQARGRYVAATGSRLDTDWSGWTNVTTPDNRITGAQIGPGAVTIGIGGNVGGEVNSDGRPAIDFSWGGHFNNNVDYVYNGATFGRPLLSYLNSGKPITDFAGGYNLNQNADYIAAGSTWGPIRLASLTGGNVDLALSAVQGRHLGNIGDATGRYAVVNGAGFKGVSLVDGSNRAGVDFTNGINLGQNLDNMADGSSFARINKAYTNGSKPVFDLSDTFHRHKTLDYMGDGSTYLRMPGANMDSNRRAIADFTNGLNLGQNLANIADGGIFARSVRTGANLIPDSNFLLGSSYWTLRTASVVASSDGGNALRVPYNSATLNSSVIPAKSSTQYTLSATVDQTPLNASGTTFFLQVNSFDAAMNLLAQHYVPFDIHGNAGSGTNATGGNVNSYSSYSGRLYITFTTSSSAAFMQLISPQMSGTGVAGYALFSAPQLEAGSTPTAYQANTPGNISLDNLNDGSGRFAIINGAGFKGVSLVDGSNRAGVDFASGVNLHQNADYIAETATNKWLGNNKVATAHLQNASADVNKLAPNAATKVAANYDDTGTTDGTDGLSFNLVKTVTLTTRGGPTSINVSGVATGTVASFQYLVKRDGSNLEPASLIPVPISGQANRFNVYHSESPPAGSHTYTFYISKRISGDSATTIDHCSIHVLENTN